MIRHFARKLALLWFAVLSVQAADLPPTLVGVDTNLVIELMDGTTFTLQRVTRMDTDDITFKHTTGISTVRFGEMTPASRMRLGHPVPALPGTDALATGDVPRITVTKPAAVQPRPCIACRGARTVVCPGCNGMKFAADQIVKTTCPECKGRRFIVRKAGYTYGGGAGKKLERRTYDEHVQCPNCNGVGQLEAKARGYCSTCNGVGVVACARCK